MQISERTELINLLLSVTMPEVVRVQLIEMVSSQLGTVYLQIIIMHMPLGMMRMHLTNTVSHSEQMLLRLQTMVMPSDMVQQLQGNIVWLWVQMLPLLLTTVCLSEV